MVKWVVKSLKWSVMKCVWLVARYSEVVVVCGEGVVYGEVYPQIKSLSINMNDNCEQLSL